MWNSASSRWYAVTPLIHPPPSWQVKLWVLLAASFLFCAWHSSTFLDLFLKSYLFYISSWLTMLFIVVVLLVPCRLILLSNKNQCSPPPPYPPPPSPNLTTLQNVCAVHCWECSALFTGGVRWGMFNSIFNFKQLCLKHFKLTHNRAYKSSVHWKDTMSTPGAFHDSGMIECGKISWVHRGCSIHWISINTNLMVLSTTFPQPSCTAQTFNAGRWPAKLHELHNTAAVYCLFKHNEELNFLFICTQVMIYY